MAYEMSKSHSFGQHTNSLEERLAVLPTPPGHSGLQVVPPSARVHVDRFGLQHYGLHVSNTMSVLGKHSRIRMG